MSNADTEINFRYIEIGTYSVKNKTWMWTWYNDSSTTQMRALTKQLKAFGELNNFEKFKEGTFSSNERECWDFTFTSLNFFNGIGCYSATSKGLKMFWILTEDVDNNKANEEKNKYVDCADHLRNRRAFVCQHLTFDSHLGFEEAFETYPNMEFEYEDDDFMAWCNLCEKQRLKNNGWNKKAMKFANIKVVCEDCYFKMKESNI